MTEIRGKDDIEGIRYDPKSGEVLTRCSSCNIYRKREDFTSSLFCLCNYCKREAGQLQEAQLQAHVADKKFSSSTDDENIYAYVGPGRRRELGRAVWQVLKPLALPVSGLETQRRKPGRPNHAVTRRAVIARFMSKHPVPKKYRDALLSLIANNALTPGQLLWLAFKPGVMSDRLLRLLAIDAAYEVVELSDLQSIVDTSYLFDDAENIVKNPSSPKVSRQVQRDLRNRIAQVAKVLADPEREHRTTPAPKVLGRTWRAYDALRAAIQPGSLRAAETTGYYFVKAHVAAFSWKPERAVKKLVQLLAKRLESSSGVASDARRAELHDTDAFETPGTQEVATSYWVSCSSIYHDDRYLVLVEEDDTHATMIVFHNPKNQLEIGRQFKVPKEQLEPGPDGYFEISADELKSQGVKLP